MNQVTINVAFSDASICGTYYMRTMSQKCKFYIIATNPIQCINSINQPHYARFFFPPRVVGPAFFVARMLEIACAGDERAACRWRRSARVPPNNRCCESNHSSDQNGAYLTSLFVPPTLCLALPLYQLDFPLTYVMNLLHHIRAEQTSR